MASESRIALASRRTFHILRKQRCAAGWDRFPEWCRQLGCKIEPTNPFVRPSPRKSRQQFYVTDEAELTTWAAETGPDGSLSHWRLFAEQGGEGVAVDALGNVYIAAGQVYVYSSRGKLLGVIEVPERPLQLVFGGKDQRTLFIPARTALYSVRTRYPGR